MSIGQQIFFFISALGAFNGFVLGLYLCLNRKGKSVAMFFLGMLLLAISIRVAQSVFSYFNPGVAKIYLQVGMSACCFIGPLLYYFFKAVLTRAATVPVTWKRSLGIQLGIILLVNIAFSFQDFPCTWNGVFFSVLYAQWFGYLVATGILLKNAWKTLAMPSGLKLGAKFGLVVFAGNGIIFLFYLLSFTGIFRGLCISGAISFSLVLYLAVFFYLHGITIENILQAPEVDQLNKPEKKKITENDALAWKEKMEKIIFHRELYKNPNLKLNDLAQAINIAPHQLSQLLNDNLGKNFPTYINEYRINEACKLITTNDRLSFEAIGYEVGYNSKSTFYTAFKKVKDTTPSLFKESIVKGSSSVL
jgi:AraC-like DNA-binding protein